MQPARQSGSGQALITECVRNPPRRGNRRKTAQASAQPRKIKGKAGWLESGSNQLRFDRGDSSCRIDEGAELADGSRYFFGGGATEPQDEPLPAIFLDVGI